METYEVYYFLQRILFKYILCQHVFTRVEQSTARTMSKLRSFTTTSMRSIVPLRIMIVLSLPSGTAFQFTLLFALSSLSLRSKKWSTSSRRVLLVSSSSCFQSFARKLSVKLKMMFAQVLSLRTLWTFLSLCSSNLSSFFPS